MDSMKPRSKSTASKRREPSHSSSQGIPLAPASNQSLIDPCVSCTDQESLQRLKRAISEAMDGFSLHNAAGLYTFVNEAEALMYGYCAEELLGQSWQVLYTPEVAADIEQQYFPILLNTGKWRGELVGLRKNGSPIDVEVSLTLLTDEQGNPDGLVCNCRDISDRKRADHNIYNLAHYDHLTGLPNRAFFQSRLDDSIALAKKHNKRMALLFIDLDDFKHINDTLGHITGDAVLCAASARVAEQFRDSDTVARLGGDEFTVILDTISHRRDAARIAQKLLGAFKQPLIIDQQEYYQNLSVGISVFPEDGADSVQLMKNADVAMYRAKAQGKNSFHFYNAEMAKEAQHHVELLTSMHRALSEEQFLLHYQPVIALDSGRIMGFEALLRWQHPEHGLRFPDYFISQAERSGLIVDMGLWVLQKACQQAKQWLDSGLEFDYIAVNVSGLQLRQNFDFEVDQVLKQSGLPPECLELEITETYLMTELQRPIALLQRIVALGVRIAIDDFGVGYSSLSRIKQLPVHRIKVDRCFVKDLGVSSDDLSIVEAVLAMAEALKLEVTAEGVETEEQMRLLQQQGNHTAQGYLFSKPLPSEQIPSLYNNSCLI